MSGSIERRYEDGQLVIRDHEAVNEFNKDGISLRAIEEEILWARFLPQFDIQVFLRRYPGLFGLSGTPNGTVPISLSTTHDVNRARLSSHLFPTFSATSEQTVRPDQSIFFQPKTNTQDHCLLPRTPPDEDIADDIGRCPLLLRISPLHASNLTEWFYRHVAPQNQEEKDHAARLLKLASGGDKPKHREKLFRYDADALRQAERDLREYRNLLRSCMKAEGDLVRVAKYFPDYQAFDAVFRSDDTAPLTQIARKHGTGLPGAARFATAFLADRIGCERVTVQTLLK